MEARLFENFKQHFPLAAKLTVKYKKTGLFDLTVKLSDGTSVLYNDMFNTIRNLPRDSGRMTEKQCRNEFGLRLSNLMLIKGVTQNVISEKTGIPQSMISRYINGKTTPSFYTADRIAKAINCSMDDFRYID